MLFPWLLLLWPLFHQSLAHSGPEHHFEWYRELETGAVPNWINDIKIVFRGQQIDVGLSVLEPPKKGQIFEICLCNNFKSGRCVGEFIANLEYNPYNDGLIHCAYDLEQHRWSHEVHAEFHTNSLWFSREFPHVEIRGPVGVGVTGMPRVPTVMKISEEPSPAKGLSRVDSLRLSRERSMVRMSREPPRGPSVVKMSRDTAKSSPEKIAKIPKIPGCGKITGGCIHVGRPKNTFVDEEGEPGPHGYAFYVQISMIYNGEKRTGVWIVQFMSDSDRFDFINEQINKTTEIRGC